MNGDLMRPVWLEKLDALLPLFGHRNWIVVADSAYPAHSSAGIETIGSAEEHLCVLRAVLQRLDAAPHVNPRIYIDAELAAVQEDSAPGVSLYRQEAGLILAGRPRRATAHERIIQNLAEAAQHFRVLIIKTPMRIPYTSVFIELGCGYRTPDTEKALRATFHAGEQEPHE